MTLRQWVETSPFGTRAEREAFETGLLESAARAVERGEPLRQFDHPDVPEDFWIMAFRYAQLTLARVGRPLGVTRG